MDINGLKKFCAVGIDYHTLSQPFSDDNYSYACTGHMIVRVPKIAEIDREVPEIVRLERVFAGMDKSKHTDLPDYEQPETKICSSCKGAGKSHGCPECQEEGVVILESDFNQYEVECKTCKGVGDVPGGEETCCNCGGSGREYIDPYAFVDFGRMGVSVKLLEKIKGLPGIKIGTMDEKDMVQFFFDGGDGALMGMIK